MRPFWFFPLLLSAGVILLAVFNLSGGFGSRSQDAQIAFSCKPSDFTGEIDEEEKTAFFDEKPIAIPSLQEITSSRSRSNVLGSTSDSRWIEVDLSEQKLKAWDGNTLFLESAVSSGLPWWPTPKGEFRVWLKLRATKMEGGSGKYYYYLPNVPFVMFFEGSGIPGWKGYGLHGTYWHNDFGRQRSHGCVNLPTSIAEQLFYWTGPVVTEGKRSAVASADNPGTRVVVHD